LFQKRGVARGRRNKKKEKRENLNQECWVLTLSKEKEHHPDLFNITSRKKGEEVYRGSRRKEKRKSNLPKVLERKKGLRCPAGKGGEDKKKWGREHYRNLKGKPAVPSNQKGGRGGKQVQEGEKRR